MNFFAASITYCLTSEDPMTVFSEVQVVKFSVTLYLSEESVDCLP